MSSMAQRRQKVQVELKVRTEGLDELHLLWTKDLNGLLLPPKPKDLIFKEFIVHVTHGFYLCF